MARSFRAFAYLSVHLWSLVVPVTAVVQFWMVGVAALQEQKAGRLYAEECSSCYDVWWFEWGLLSVQLQIAAGAVEPCGRAWNMLPVLAIQRVLSCMFCVLLVVVLWPLFLYCSRWVT